MGTTTVNSCLLVVITEYLVNISKRHAFWSLNKDILKITILTTNTPYPSRKIRRIRACTHQRPQRKQDQYAVSREDQYAVLEIYEVANIPCDSNKDDDSEQRMSHEADDDIGYDPSDVVFTEWLGSKNLTTRRWIIIQRKHYGFTGLEEMMKLSSHMKSFELAEVFRIDTNIFDFETPMCKTFKEFNYLLQIDPDLLTKDIEGFKTYEKI
ncbi:hypothetical protein Tco_0518037 [Tanacetum coccineum]